MKRTLLFALLVLSACTKNPVTGRNQFLLYSEEEEIAFGNRWAPALVEEMGGLYDDPQIQGLVEEVGQKLVAHVPALAKEEGYSSKVRFRFYVVNTSDINAFALMGGHVFFTRGILAEMKSEDELAAVMGHEIMHIVGKHTNASMWQDLVLAPLPIFGALKALHYSRKDEAQSDKYGLKLMVQAGYNPKGMVELFEMFVREAGSSGWMTFLSSHPDSAERMKDAQDRCVKYYQEACDRPRPMERFEACVAQARAEKPLYKIYEDGMALLAKEEYRGAVAKFSEAISRKEDPIFYRDRGLAYGCLKQYDESVRDLTRAISMSPDMMKPYLYRGLVLQEAGEPGEALADLERANQKFETSVAHYYIGRCHDDLGNGGEARKRYKKVLVLEGCLDEDTGEQQPPDEDASDHVKDAWKRYRG